MSTDDGTFMYEYLKEDYDRETERYARYRDRVSFVSGFILLLGSGITTLLTSYMINFESLGLRDGVFVFSMVCVLCFFVAALYFLVRAAIPEFKFGNVAAADVLWSSYCKWSDYAANSKVTNKPDVEVMFRKNISTAFAKAAASNRKTTEGRSKLLALAMRCAVISGIILIAPAVCSVLRIYDKPESGPIQVEVVSPIKLK